MLRTRTFQSLSASDDIKVLYDKISKLEPVVITHALSGTSFPKDGDVINITESKYNQLVSAFDNFNPVIIKTQCSSIRCYAVPYASENNGNIHSVYNYKMFLDIPKLNTIVDEEGSFGRYSYIDIPLKSKIKEDKTYDLVYRINKNDLSIYDYNIEGISIDQLKPNTTIQSYNQNYYTKVKECVELGGRLYLYYNDTVINKLKVTHLNTARSSTDKNNYIEYIVCDLRRDTLTLDEDLLIVFILGYSTDSEGVSTSEYVVSIMSNNITRSDIESVLVGNVSSHNHDNMYLNKTNTSSFTPTSDYHPATKKYVDDNKQINYKLNLLNIDYNDNSVIEWIKNNINTNFNSYNNPLPSSSSISINIPKYSSIRGIFESLPMVKDVQQNNYDLYTRYFPFISYEGISLLGTGSSYISEYISERRTIYSITGHIVINDFLSNSMSVSFSIHIDANENSSYSITFNNIYKLNSNIIPPKP